MSARSYVCVLKKLKCKKIRKIDFSLLMIENLFNNKLITGAVIFIYIKANYSYCPLQKQGSHFFKAKILGDLTGCPVYMQNIELKIQIIIIMFQKKHLHQLFQI